MTDVRGPRVRRTGEEAAPPEKALADAPIAGDVRAQIIRQLRRGGPLTRRELQRVVGKEVGRPSASLVEAQLEVLIGQGIVDEVQFGRRYRLGSVPRSS